MRRVAIIAGVLCLLWWPGPEAHAFVHQSSLHVPEEGPYREHFGTRAPLKARVSAKGFYAEPAVLDIASERGSYEVTLHRSAQLTVRPRGLPPAGFFQMSVHDAESGEEIDYDLAGAHGPQGPDGSPYQQHVRSNLRPGSYRVEIEVDLYQTRSVVVDVVRRGARILIEPLLRELPNLGALTLKASLRPGMRVEDPKHVGLFRLWVRRAGDGKRGWHAPDWFEEDWRKAQVQIVKLPAGRYDLLLWETQERGVGLLRNVVVRAGETTHAALTLGRGHRFPLKPLTKAVWNPDGLLLRTPDLGEVPAVIDAVFGLHLLDRLGGPEKTAFGPYPFAELEAQCGPEEDPRLVRLRSDR